MAIYSAVPPPPEFGGNEANTSNNGHPQQEQQQQQQGESHNAASTLMPPSSSATLQTNSGVDIDAWTIEALQSLNVSPLARGTGANLSIPLDEHDADAAAAGKVKKANVSIYDPRRSYGAGGITPPPRPSSRRDSMKRREALLKGNEGSRQRRRWENDRLLHVPNATPPEPQDMLPRPTHPVHHVPYHAAAAWELRVRAEVEKRDAALKSRKATLTRTLGDDHVPGRVPRELCRRAKKTPAVRIWVRSLEEPVRRYLVEQQQRFRSEGAEDHAITDDDDDYGSGTGSVTSMDSEDEEIVFVGRNGAMRDGGKSGCSSSSKSKIQSKANSNTAKLKGNGSNWTTSGDIENIGGQWRRARRETKATGETQDEGMLFDGLGDADGGAFRRWITHSISEYYGLQSQSVLVSDPERKIVYVGIKRSQTTQVQMKTGHRHTMSAAIPTLLTHLPRPLWELC
ncbi:hypothetical protein F5Y17DRAFT_333951 [Xylariaceae sp. FL0594]|nr:hypothetical protein F5Y17DRAFT_333951 [Xylariaceae sp. FL0594]